MTGLIIRGVILFLFFARTLPARLHDNFWFRTTLSIPLNSKISFDTEFQHRRQNGFYNQNMFDKSLMFTFRNWIHYQPASRVKISVSPFAYFRHYRIIQKESDSGSTPVAEVRFSAAAEFQPRIFAKVFLVDRVALEYRMFQTAQSDMVRFRNRFGFRWAYNSNINVSVFDEILLNVSEMNSNHFGDHNRLGFILEYKMLNRIKFETGYIYIYRISPNPALQIAENNVFLNLTYQIHNP